MCTKGGGMSSYMRGIGAGSLSTFTCLVSLSFDGHANHGGSDKQKIHGHLCIN